MHAVLCRFSHLLNSTTIHTSINLPTDGSTIPGGPLVKSKVSIGEIVGSVIGGIVLLAFIILCSFLYRRRQQNRNRRDRELELEPVQSIDPSISLFRGLPGVSGGQNFPHWRKHEKGRAAEIIVSESMPSQFFSNENQTSDGVSSDIVANRELLQEENEFLRHQLQHLREESLPPSYSEQFEY